MHLTCGHYARSWGYRILTTCQMRKSEEPLVVHRFLTWWLIDVCGSSAIFLAVHLARITTEPLHRVSDKYCLTGSDQQEDLATLGSVQLRQTFALWTLTSQLPGERPLLETNGDILWTQQCSSGVRYERRKKVKCYRQLVMLVVFKDPPPSPPLGHIWDVMLFWRKGNINKNCPCVTVACTIIMVHKDTSSSYR